MTEHGGERNERAAPRDPVSKKRSAYSSKSASDLIICYDSILTVTESLFRRTCWLLIPTRCAPGCGSWTRRR